MKLGTLRAPSSELGKHLVAVAALLLLIVALFWRVLFFGETIVDLAAHSNQLPWGSAVTTYRDYPYSRRDLTDTYITRDYFVVESYRKGELPLWNPYIFSGHPIYADGVTKLFAPTLLLYRWFDIPLGYSLARLLELALAAIFLYLLLLNYRLGAGGAFAGAAIFLLSDHVMQHLSWLGWLGGLMWLPLMLLGADLAVRRQRMLPAIAAGVALALQFYCGYMPTAIYYLSALAGYYLAAPWLINHNRARLDAIKSSVKYLLITLIVGFGLSAIIWLPIFELLSFSNRKIVPTEISYIWLPPWQLLTLILPFSFGRAFDTDITRRFLEVGVSQDRSVYLGLITLSFIWAVFWRRGLTLVLYQGAKVESKQLGIKGLALYDQIYQAEELTDTTDSETASDNGEGDQALDKKDQLVESNQVIEAEKAERLEAGQKISAKVDASKVQKEGAAAKSAAESGKVEAVRRENLKAYRADRIVCYFAGLAIFALLVMLCAPIYVHITKYLPVLKTIRAITRISGLYAFSGAVLAGFGVARLLSLDRNTLNEFLGSLRRLLLPLIGLLIAALLLFSAFGRWLPQNDSEGNRIRRWGLKVLLTLAEQFHWQNPDLLIPFAILLLLFAICWYFPRTRWPIALLPGLLIAITIAELIWNGQQYNQTYPRSTIFQATAATDLVKANLGLARVVVAPAEFSSKAEESDGHKIVAPPNTLVPYQIATIAGKDQLFPKWYRELTSLVEPQKYLSHIVFNRMSAPLYDLLGVKYLITRDVNSADEANYREVFHGDGVRIYENLTVMPRAFFAEQVEQVTRAEDTVKRLKTEGFDLHKTVLVTAEKPIAALDQLAASGPEDRVEILNYRNNEVVLRAKSSGSRLLVLTDSYYPGWDVTVDNQPAELLRADHALRAVILNAGEHQVRFSFHPRAFRNGIMISLATLIVCLLAMIKIGLDSRGRRLFTRN